MSAPRVAGAVAVVVAAAAAMPARAQSCAVNTSGVAFGAYSPFAALPNTSTGSVSLSCGVVAVAQSLAYSVRLSGGGAADVLARRMTSAASASLSYQLYTTPTYLSVWGDGSPGSSTVSGLLVLSIVSSALATHTVYGRMPAGQTGAVAGSYSDPIVVTVSY